jgi:omega-6 fatty acid desaturase (delta-12 desaturase)
VLRWFSANIGVHHVHHLSSRIPSYRLGEVLRDHPELRDLNRMTIKDTFGCFRLALWDEDRGRMVSFRQAAAMARRGRGGAEGEPRTESFGLPTAAPPLPAGSTG